MIWKKKFKVAPIIIIIIKEYYVHIWEKSIGSVTLTYLAIYCIADN